MIHNKQNLPDNLQGNWIWSGNNTSKVESYNLLSRQFTLSELPLSGEIYIACRSFFHLWINDEHVSYKLNVCPVRGSYVWYYDILHLMETGTNKISVLAHNIHVARLSCRQQPNGFWCQLNIDGKPYLWTDRDWSVMDGDKWYYGNRPRRSQSLGFTEKIDFRHFPSGWREPGSSLPGWKNPDYCAPLQNEGWQMISAPLMTMKSNHIPCSTEIRRGRWRKAVLSTHLTFNRLTSFWGPGVYGAETYFFSKTAQDVDYRLFADDPYRLFINSECVKDQNIRPLQPGFAFKSDTSLCFRQGEITPPRGVISLQKGWNRINFYMQCADSNTGMTLLFDSLAADGNHLCREPGEDSMPGWTIYGPMETPLASMLGTVELTELPNKEFYIPTAESIGDTSAELAGCTFEEEEPSASDSSDGQSDWTLKEGDYIQLKIESVSFGCPRLVLQGSSGDVIDIAADTELSRAGLVSPVRDTWRNGDSIILGANECEWLACLPRGIKYIMVVARKVQKDVSIKEAGVLGRNYDFENRGHFEASDKMVNQIWETGGNTLAGTIQDVFIDSPCKEETQFIADAMIQSWASFSVFGNYTLAEKALKEFAACQFETGEMPAAAPSGIYLNIPDYALLWPVWLQKYYLFSGKKSVVEELSGHLKRLFSYFAAVSQPDSQLLGEHLRSYGGYCFLDQGDIDMDGVVTGLNALYSRALLSGAWLFEEIGMLNEAQECRRKAAVISDALRRRTWDEQKGLFADCYSNGQSSDSFTTQTNILTLYGGVVEPEEYTDIFDKLFTDEVPFYRMMPPENNNPYFNFFILEVAFALNRRQWAYDFMNWYWGAMLKEGATSWWELFDPRPEAENLERGSSCFGYGTSPNAFLIREIAGIRPAKPGFSSVYFNPLLTAVSSVNARVPTPYGHLTVQWELKGEKQLEATLTSNYPVSVIPQLEPAVAETATINVNDEITIFAAE
ncbi:MAG: alpha-L-rhamnosidase C-terminal domain-containing protein [Verrucomicrobiota bacterium]